MIRVLIALVLLCAFQVRAAYEIVQVTPTVIGGVQTIVSAPGPAVPIPGLSVQITLQNPNHGISCRWSVSAQTDTAGAAIFLQLVRGGVPLGISQPIYSSAGAIMATVGDGLVSDTPGYVGPLVYSVVIGPIIGQGRAPANFGGAGSLTCNEVVLP